ncbi:FcoT family thioesterase [Streptomyces phytophilus]|uniref:FcoT family thioesterase n=1 Tax=Streptomyces phytophilus TaxID=722715 RepID=UPI0015F0B408|nr:FcoT family thioesterase [Streptomyces phytophilus]
MAVGGDEALLERVLRVYKPHCRYLESATVAAGGDPADEGGQVGIRGRFHIPESCYIDDTGHFNAVEFNICYNQMIYLLMAKSVERRLMRSFAGWSMDDFWARQLADMFIVDFHSSFRRHMRGRRFWGELDVVEAFEGDWGSGPFLFLRTTCRFGEADEPAAHGKVLVAVKAGAGADDFSAATA